MRRKLSQDVWVLVLLVLFTLVVGYFVGRDQGGGGEFEMLPHRTTYSSKPAGLKGLYDTLHKLDYRVVRHLEPLTSPPKDGVFFMAAPTVPVSSEEWQSLRNWVERGNLLVISLSDRVSEAAIADAESKVASIPTAPSFLLPDVRSFTVLSGSRIRSESCDFGADGSFAAPFG